MTAAISIAHLVRDQAQVLPDLDVLTFEHEGRQEVRTYSQLWRNGQSLAAGLADLGVGPGDRIGLLLQNHPEFVEAMVGAAILGAVITPLDPRMKGEKLAFMLINAGCSGVVCGDYSLGALGEVLDQTSEIRWIVAVGEAAPAARFSVPVTSIADVASRQVDPRPIAVTDSAAPMQIMYSSGTTGDPKGIVISHGRFIAAGDFGRALFGYVDDDRPYTGLSLTHGNGQYVTLAPSLAMGLRAVISRRFTKSRLWDVIRRNGCTTFSLLGGMATAIYAEPPRPDDGQNPVRHVVSAGMPAAIWDAFRDRFAVDIIEFYGAMEGGLTLNPIGTGPVGSCGRPAPAFKVRIVDEDGNDVPDGQPGELLFGLVDGTPMVVDYLGAPEASAHKTRGGWLHSGDIVIRDSEGWLFFQHRAGGGIRHNGDFVSPAAVEKIVAEHPQVADTFIWGITAASGAPGEKDIVAAIVPVDAARFDADSVFEWCAERLERNMVPSFLQVVPEIPKTASEKPQERFLKAAFEADPGALIPQPIKAEMVEPERKYRNV